MLEINKCLGILLETSATKGLSPLIVRVYERGGIGINTAWECIQDEVASEIEAVKPNKYKIPVLAEAWGEMVKLNYGLENSESDELWNKISKMCQITLVNKVHNNIDSGLLEIARVLAENNLMCDFPIFDSFKDIKIREKAVCCGKKFS